MFLHRKKWPDVGFPKISLSVVVVNFCHFLWAVVVVHCHVFGTMPYDEKEGGGGRTKRVVWNLRKEEEFNDDDTDNNGDDNGEWFDRILFVAKIFLLSLIPLILVLVLMLIPCLILMSYIVCGGPKIGGEVYVDSRQEVRINHMADSSPLFFVTSHTQYKVSYKLTSYLNSVR